MVTKRRSLDPPGRTGPGLFCTGAWALLGGLAQAWSALEPGRSQGPVEYCVLRALLNATA